MAAPDPHSLTRKLSPIPATRIRSASRTIREVLRLRRRWSLSTPLPLKDADGAVIGYVDQVILRDGRLLVEGWAKSPSLRLQSELESRWIEVYLQRTDVPQDVGPANGFRAIIDGTDRLIVSNSSNSLCEIRIGTLTSRMMAWARTMAAVAHVPLRNGGDLLAWFLQGDSEAGTRLERLLLPPQPLPAFPQAAPGLLARTERPLPSCPDGIDIIIPIFNAHDDLQACLKRVQRFTRPEHRVILIDDASTDPRIAPLLTAFAASRAGVSLISLTQNGGFVQAVNLGLDRSRGHVVLLNTDAFVGEGWVDRLMAPILADPTAASVTPMTNNGEIASVPIICQGATLAEGAIDRIDAVARRFDPLSAIVDAPTGVGFCMAMSRYWLEKVPRFDVAFGRGYGEEVDWCQRIAALGGRNVLTGAVFVEHRGGMSFSTEKRRLIEDHNRLIAHRYPDYDASVFRFIRTDPGVGPRLALGMAAAGSTGAAVPIYLAHNLGGGAEHWLNETLAQHKAAKEIAVVVRDCLEPEHLRIELHDPAGVTVANVPQAELATYLSAPHRRRLVYSNLVGARAPLELLEQAIAVLSPDEDLEILFHDFLPLCPSYNLIGVGGRFCGLPETTACETCYAGLGTTSGRRPATLAEWRSRWRRILDRATAIVSFSDDSRGQIARVWPDLAPRIQVRPHECGHLPPRLRPLQSHRLTIGVLGGIGYSKGAGILHGLAQAADEDVDLIVIGKLDPAFSHARIKVHGPYDRNEIPELATRYQIKAWLIPSIWPETFCFTVHEALATGLPVFVYGLGAQAEAARRAANGHVLPDGFEEGTLLDHIRQQVASDGQLSVTEPIRTTAGDVA